jgi:hypothetical protein
MIISLTPIIEVAMMKNTKESGPWEADQEFCRELEDIYYEHIGRREPVTEKDEYVRNRLIDRYLTFIQWVNPKRKIPLKFLARKFFHKERRTSEQDYENNQKKLPLVSIHEQGEEGRRTIDPPDNLPSSQELLILSSMKSALKEAVEEFCRKKKLRWPWERIFVLAIEDRLGEQGLLESTTEYILGSELPDEQIRKLRRNTENKKLFKFLKKFFINLTEADFHLLRKSTQQPFKGLREVVTTEAEFHLLSASSEPILDLKLNQIEKLLGKSFQDLTNVDLCELKPCKHSLLNKIQEILIEKGLWYQTSISKKPKGGKEL